ncbi:MAG: YybS family protein [Deltaproteobacteria bacterium]
MSNNQQYRTVAIRLAETALGVVVSSVLFAAYMAIPLAGFFSGLLAPFPATFFRLRHGPTTGVIIILGTTALLTAGFGFQAGLLYLLQCGVIAFMSTELLVHGYGGTRTIAWTVAANVAILAAAALVYCMITGENIHALATNEINTSIAQTIRIYESAGIKGDDLVLVKQSMTWVGALIGRVYPALVTIMLIIATGFNLFFCKRSASRMGIELKVGSFYDFRNPELLIWLLIAAGFALLSDNPIINVPGLNLLAVTTTLYFLQGLAAMLTIIARQSFVGLLRVMLFVMLLFQPYLIALVAAFGIFDLWGDFRTPAKIENL